ncbi:MAG: 50S ribosomal protein L11 methyltransferase [bacterium]|nr:50S ribosomal protein L11 methyltransferase [bacterium]
MIEDPHRTDPLLAAIKKTVRSGDLVVDVGTGLGLLAIASVQAGAGHVWGIDYDKEALNYAKKAANRAGVFEKISWIPGLSFEAKLKKRVDLILCETVGSYAFDENILATLADAKRRFLKKTGKIIPACLELWGAPLCRIPRKKSASGIVTAKKNDLMATPLRLARINFQENFKTSLRIKEDFVCKKGGILRAMAVWPKVYWTKENITEASPLLPPTHWQQGILGVEAKKIRPGEKIHFELIMRPHPDHPREKTERLWRAE